MAIDLSETSLRGAQLRRRFFALALPNVLANLMVPLSGLVDTALLGHLPEIAALAGVGLASVIFDYLFWSFGFLRMGTTGITAQALGAGDEDEIVLTLGRASLVALALGVAILALSGPIESLSFALLDGAAEVESAGRDYFRGRVLGAPVALLNFVLLGHFLGRQRVGALLLMSMVGNLSNVGLDAWFIWGLGWGPWGAGLATALSQLAMFLVGLALLRPLQQWRELRRLRARLRDAAALRRLAALSVDILVRTFALLSAFALFTNGSAALGTVTLTANTVMLKALSTAAFFIDGYAFATEGLAGLAKGRGDTKAMRALLKLALVTGLVTGLIFGLVFWLFPELFALLTDHAAPLAEIAAQRGWLAALLVFSSVAYVLDGYFLGLAAGPALRRAMVVSFAVGFLPPWIFARYLAPSSTLLWCAMLAFMVMRVLTLGAEVPKTLIKTVT